MLKKNAINEDVNIGIVGFSGQLIAGMMLEFPKLQKDDISCILSKLIQDSNKFGKMYDLLSSPFSIHINNAKIKFTPGEKMDDLSWAKWSKLILCSAAFVDLKEIIEDFFYSK